MTSLSSFLLVLLALCLPETSGASSLPLTTKLTIEPTVRRQSSSNRIPTTTPLRSITRNFNFWGRAGRIYATYKILQIRLRSRRLLSRIFLRDRINSTSIKDTWDQQHEINAQRMMNLCLGLRGFYLKTGQFLGTRHDFMPAQFTQKLSRLHDNVPPLPAEDIKHIIESELKGPLDKYFIDIDLEHPIGSASIAQVHHGRWKATGEKVAIKVQYPNAESLMKSDLRNLRMLAEFLQRTELKFDILSSIKELQKNIHNEFDFINEAKNMESMRESLKSAVPEVVLPRALYASKRSLVMTFVDGRNLGKLAEFAHNKMNILVPVWVKQQMGKKILDVVSKAWGEMIFNLQWFNSDPHPGNICLCKDKIGLLDWGQMKRLSDDSIYKFSRFIEAMNSRDQNRTVEAFLDLGIKVGNPERRNSVEGMAVTMLDTRVMPGYDMDPFSPNNVNTPLQLMLFYECS